MYLHLMRLLVHAGGQKQARTLSLSMVRTSRGVAVRRCAVLSGG